MYRDFTSLHVGKVLSARVLYVYTIDLNIKKMFLVVILQKDTQVLTYLFSQFIKSPIPKAENLQARTNAHILSLTWLWHIGKFIFNLRGKQFSCTQQSFRLLISFSKKRELEFYWLYGHYFQFYSASVLISIFYIILYGGIPALPIHKMPYCLAKRW